MKKQKLNFQHIFSTQGKVEQYKLNGNPLISDPILIIIFYFYFLKQLIFNVSF